MRLLKIKTPDGRMLVAAHKILAIGPAKAADGTTLVGESVVMLEGGLMLKVKETLGELEARLEEE